MNRQEHIRLHCIEEALETAHRVTKAMRFGMDEVQRDQEFTNRDRVIFEYNDFVAVMEMAGFPLQVIEGPLLDAKIAKVNRYLAYAYSIGTLVDDKPPLPTMPPHPARLDPPRRGIHTLRQLRDHLNELIDGDMGKLYNVGDLRVAINGSEPDFPISVALCDPQDIDGFATIGYE